jgi:hypothetical protein
MKEMNWTKLEVAFVYSKLVINIHQHKVNARHFLKKLSRAVEGNYGPCFLARLGPGIPGHVSAACWPYHWALTSC